MKSYLALESPHYLEIFNENQTTWLVDDMHIYHDSISMKPTNAAIFIFNPTTGKSFLKIMDASVLDEQKSDVLQAKSAEEVAAIVHSLPVEYRPKQIIVTSKELMDPLQAKLLKFPNIVIRSKELRLQFQSWVKMGDSGELVHKTMDPQLLLLDMYGDWLDSIKPREAFARLALMLGALHINQKAAESILNVDVDMVMDSDEQWEKIEDDLTDLLISDFAKKKSVNKCGLTLSEINPPYQCRMLISDILKDAQEYKELLEEQEHEEMMATYALADIKIDVNTF